MVLALAGCSAQPASTGGIVSTNPCADQLLLALAPRARIAAISHYSQEAAATSVPLDVARRFRGTAGTAEEVIALKPDLVLASSFTPAATLHAYRRLGLKVLLLDSPTTIAASRDQIRAVAAALGARDSGERLIARIDSAVAVADQCSQPPFALSLSKPVLSDAAGGVEGGARDNRTSTSSVRTDECGERPTALLFISNNFANGGPTLLSEMLARAGFGTDNKATVSSAIPIEQVMNNPPAVILDPDLGGRAATLRRRVLARAGLRVAEAAFPRTLINCGGPTIVPAMQRLTAVRASLTR